MESQNPPMMTAQGIRTSISEPGRRVRDLANMDFWEVKDVTSTGTKWILSEY
mgnify:CR=1 FL=1